MSDSIRIDDLTAEINRLVEDYGKSCAATTKRMRIQCCKKDSDKTKTKLSG